MPLPTGIVFPAAQTSGSAVVAPAAASTTGALSATGLNSKVASFTGTTVPTTAKSTASLATLSQQSTTAAAGGATASSAGASSAGASSAGANSAAAGSPAPASATAKPNAGSRGLEGSVSHSKRLMLGLGLHHLFIVRCGAGSCCCLGAYRSNLTDSVPNMLDRRERELVSGRTTPGRLELLRSAGVVICETPQGRERKYLDTVLKVLLRALCLSGSLEISIISCINRFYSTGP